MRQLITTIFALTALTACGGKSDAPAGSTGGGDEPAAEAGAKLTLEKSQAVAAALQLGEGWQQGMNNVKADDFFLSYQGPKNDRNAHVNLVVTGMNCMLGMCAELTADAWKKNETNLKGKLSQVLKDSPDLVFEIAETDAGGHKAIGIYSLAFVATPTEHGTSRVSTHNYDLYWHDGGKFVNVAASAGATGAETRAELESKVTRQELEDAAKKALGLIIGAL